MLWCSKHNYFDIWLQKMAVAYLSMLTFMGKIASVKIIGQWAVF